MNDPLAQFRKKPVGGQVPPTGSGSEQYAAFGAKDKVERLKIRRAFDPTRAPSYAYLLDLAYDGEFGTNFVLVYSFMMVLVRGKNLQPVIMALESGSAEFIQQFDSSRWPKPADPKTPIIDTIEVVVKEGGDAVADAEQVGSGRPH